MRGHAYKTFPFPMNTFHFVNCFMFRIQRLNRCLEGCSLTEFCCEDCVVDFPVAASFCDKVAN